MAPEDMRTLLDSWLLHLRAERKSPNTVASYGDGVRRFLAWCAQTGTEPTLDRSTVDRFVIALLEAGAEGATAAARQAAVRRFSRWLAAEDEIEADELVGLTMPKVHQKPLKPLTDDELVALFAACKGKTFVDVRDEALARVMAEAFSRCEDTLSMTVSGTNIAGGSAAIIGKGNKPRYLPFGARTGVALDRYLRKRRTHRLAATDTFWLGDRGASFGYDGLYRTLKLRAERAGIADFHPHRLRGTGATRWLRAGGSESGLMAAAGWTNYKMLHRYTEYTRQARAVEEARGLNLGDL
jgi:integrase/recombinase XerD